MLDSTYHLIVWMNEENRKKMCVQKCATKAAKANPKWTKKKKMCTI